MYGKEVVIKADNLQHTYILNCKELYSPGKYLKVRIKNIEIENNVFELSSKEFLENHYKNIRKYITEGGEYTGKVIAFQKNNSGIIVQLEKTNNFKNILDGRIISKKDNIMYHIIVADSDNEKGVAKLINSYPLSIPKADKLILLFENESQLENINCDIDFYIVLILN